MSKDEEIMKKQKGGPQEGSGRPAKDGPRLSGKLSGDHGQKLEEVMATGKFKTRVEAIEAGIENLYENLVGVKTDGSFD